MRLITAIRSAYWTFYLRFHNAKVGKNLRVGGPLNILLRDGATLKNLTIGDNVTFDGKTYIRMRKSGKIIIGNGVRLGTETWLVTANDSELSIGENCDFGGYSILNGGHGIHIGAHCISGGFLNVNSSNHKYRKGELIQKQGYYGAPIEIGDDVWLGGHLNILNGVKIGTGAVIGAGSVVTKDISDYKIVAGNPARVIGERE
jgi:acetyltransferase-like isoleucine patch superfamily enzyme